MSTEAAIQRITIAIEDQEVTNAIAKINGLLAQVNTIMLLGGSTWQIILAMALEVLRAVIVGQRNLEKREKQQMIFERTFAVPEGLSFFLL